MCASRRRRTDEDLADGGATRPTQSSARGKEGHERDSGHSRRTGGRENERMDQRHRQRLDLDAGPQGAGELLSLLPAPVAMRGTAAIPMERNVDHMCSHSSQRGHVGDVSSRKGVCFLLLTRYLNTKKRNITFH